MSHRFRLYSSICMLLAAVGFFPAIGRAQATAPAVSAGTVAMGSSVSARIVFTFTASTTVNHVYVTTQGTANLDFTASGASDPFACASGTYAPTTYCDVNITFSPKAPGARLGSAILTNGSDTAEAVGYISGVGVGALADFSTGIAGNFTTSVANPRGPSVTAGGDIYFADSTTANLYKIPSGSTSAQLFLTTSSGINSATAVDGAGNLYFNQPTTGTVFEVIAGTTTPVSIATYANSDDIILVDGAGNIYLSNSSTGAIVKFAAGTRAQSTVLAAGKLGRVIGMAVDISGNIFAADFTNNAVYKIVAGSGTATKIIATDGYLNSPHGLVLDPAGNIYITNYSGSTGILKYEYNSTSNTYASPVVLTEATGHQGLAIDSAGNLIYINGSNVGFDHRNTTPAMAFSPTYATQNSSQQTITIENDGDAALAFTSLTATEGYSLTGSGETCSTSSSVAMDSTCVLAVVFSPVTAADSSGTISISGNLPATETFKTSGTVDFGPFAQTVTFNAPTSPVAILSSQTLSATASSGLAVSFYITSGPGVITNGNVLSYTGSGTVVVSAIQNGSAVYQPSPSVTQSVTVNRASYHYPVPASNVNTTVSGTAAVPFNVAGTIGSIQIFYRGAQNQDFKLAPGGSCTIGMAVNPGDSCVVNYTFTPLHPGVRPGGITVLSQNGVVLGATLLASGIGTGPQVIFSSNTATTTIASGFSVPGQLMLDGNNNVFVVDTRNDFVAEIYAANNYAADTILPGSLYLPGGVTLDGNGNLFVGDFSNYGTSTTSYTGLVQYSPQNNYTQPATVGQVCYQEDTGQLVIGSDGDLFVSCGGPEVWRYDYLAGGWNFAGYDNSNLQIYTMGQNNLSDLSLDARENLLSSESYGGEVFMAPAPGYQSSSIVAGFFSDGDPLATAADAAGNLFMDISYANIVREQFASGIPNQAILSNIQADGIFLDGSGNMFLSDTGNRVIRRLDYADAPTLTFPNTPIGSTSSQTVTIMNDGNAQLTIASLAKQTSTFTVAGSTCTSGLQINPGYTCAITVNFTPLVTGPLSDVVTLTDNHLNLVNATQPMNVTGTGTLEAQNITFTQPTSTATAGTSATLVATASSGLPVSLSVTSGPATATGNVVTYNGPGTVVIAANQPGNATYSAAPTVSYTVTVAALTVNVGTTSSTQSVTLLITTAGTSSGNGFAFTNGAPSGDYNLLSGASAGTCTARAYNVGDTCTENYTFTPSYPGARPGAIFLATGPGVIMASAYVSDFGVGPMTTFTPGVSSNYATGMNGATAIAVDNQNQFFYAQQGAKTLTRQLFGSTVIASNVNQITGVVVDAIGNVFFGSYGDNKIYENAGGGTTTVAVASVSSPDVGMAIDSTGDLFVPSGSSVVKVKAATFAVSTVATVSGASIPGVAVDSVNNIYFTDYAHNTIYKLANGATTPTAIVTTGLSGPRGIAVDPAGNLYVANATAQTLVRLAAGTYVSTILASGAAFNTVTIDKAGNIYSPTGSAIFSLSRVAATALSFSTGNTTTSAAQPVTLENDGNATLTLSSATITSGPFSFATPATTCSNNLALTAAAPTCVASIIFSPTLGGNYNATATFTDNSLNATGASHTVAMTGISVVGTTSQTITFPQPASSYSGLQQNMTATSSSGLPITYSITSGPATVSGSTVTYTGVGTVVIAANQYGTATYAAAPTTSVTVTVAPFPSTGQFGSVNVGSSGSPAYISLTFTTSGTLNSSLAIALQTGTQGINGLDYTIVNPGTTPPEDTCLPGMIFTQGQTCFISVIFAPTAPGQRLSAVRAYDNGAANGGVPSLVGTAFISGIGIGPAGVFSVAPLQSVANVNSPRGISLDAAGNVYVSAQSSGQLYKYSQTAPLASFTQTLIATNLSGPGGTAMDGAGNLFFDDGDTIYEITAGVLAGTPPFTPVQIGSVPGADNSLAIDYAGNLYVPGANGQITQIAAGTHNATTIIPANTIGRVIGMTIDAAGNLFLADFTNNAIDEVPAGTSTVVTIIASDGYLNNPHALARDNAGNLYVGNYNGDGNVLKYTFANGVYTYSELQILGQVSLAVATNGALYSAINSSLYETYRPADAMTFNNYINVTGTPQSVNFENDGNATLTITSLAATGDFSIAGSGSSACTASIALTAGTSCGLTVTYSPATLESVQATSTVSYTSPTGIAYQRVIALTGTTTKAPQTINFPAPPSPAYLNANGSTYTLNATSSAGTNYPVTYTITGPATLTGSVLTYNAVGTVKITASQAGDSNTSAATSVAQTVSVQLTPQTITFPPSPSPAAVGTTLTLNASSSLGAGYPITYSVTGPATISGTTLTYTFPGTVVITASQPGDAYTASATVSHTVLVNRPLATGLSGMSITAHGTSVSTVAPATVITLTATAIASSVPTAGTILFCDAAATACTGLHVIGTAQLTSSGTATYSLIPGIGSHSYKAMLVSPTSSSSNVTAAMPLTVTGFAADTTTLASSGTAGNYVLTATVTGAGATIPTGTVSMLDTSKGNAILGNAPLVAGTSTLSFTASQIATGSACTAKDVVLADFNGDGKPDLAIISTCGSSPGTLTIAMGNGDGTFSAPTGTAGLRSPITVGAIPYSIVAGDFNNDGKIDLAIACENYVSIYFGNGDGTFTFSASITAYAALSLGVGDFNRDGNLDIVALNYNSSYSTLGILLNNGDGTFSNTTADAGYLSSNVVVADFNGDGIPDLAVTVTGPGDYSQDYVSIYLGAGDGTFSQTNELKLPTTVPNYSSFSPYGIVAVDLNGDGMLDLAVTDATSNHVYIFLNSGGGAFTFSPNYYTTGQEPLAIAAGDLNGDGFADLVITNAISGTDTVLLGKGDGTFATTVAAQSAAGRSPAGVALADLNGDGFADIAVADKTSEDILLTKFANKATATVSNVSPYGAGTHLVDASYPGSTIYAPSLSTTVSLTGSATNGTTAQTITFSPPANVFAGQTVALAATSTSGLPITFTILSGPATITNSSITYTAAGTVVIAANQYGNTTYAPAATVSRMVGVIVNSVWLVNNNATATRISAGSDAGTTVGAPGTTSTAGGVAFDASGNAWYVTSANNTLSFTTSTGSGATTYSGGGLNAPSAVAVDGAGTIWIANSGSSSVTVFNNAGTAQTTTAYNATASQAPVTTQGTPSSILIDNAGSVWLTNKTGNSVTHIFGAATPVTTPLGAAVTQSTLGAKP